ncbi:MAG: DUF4401 domain-containing protein [Planctomycetes bacterium]|nr:DUF4401 domain-containing protein [Planctomycetota bacterium]
MADPGTESLLETNGLSAEELDRVRHELVALRARPVTPWFVAPFVFLGALLGATLISIGVAVVIDIEWHTPQVWMLSVFYFGSAYALYRARAGSFADDLGLALSIGAHAFGLVAVADQAEPGHRGLPLTICAFVYCAVGYPLIRDTLHRFLACTFVFFVAKVALPHDDLQGVLHAILPIAAATCAWSLTRPRSNPTLFPLAYACGVGLIVLLLPLTDRGLWFEDVDLLAPWWPSVVCGVALLGAAEFAMRRAGWNSTLARVLLLVAVAGIGVLGAPGVLAVMFLAVLGYASFHERLAIVALLSLPLFVFEFYFALDVSLLAKAGTLVGTGLVLLAARFVMRRGRVPNRGDA